MMMTQNHLAADLDHVLEHTRELWEELRGGRIFITGGTGFFGCWMLESFAWANDRLGLKASALVLTRHLGAFREKAPHLAVHPAIQFHPGDIHSFKYPVGSFSHIIHAAGESSTKMNAEAPLTIIDSIVDATHRTLEFGRQCGVQKILLTSSGAVYGRQPPEMTHISEEFPGAPDPTNPYYTFGKGKRAAETLCALYAKKYGFEAKIARCFAFVGPYLPLDSHFAIGNFIRDGLHGGPIIVLGDGTPGRSYLYASDLAIWLWTILFRGQSCRPYNVGSDESLSIAEVAHRVAEQFPSKIAVEIRGTPNPLKPLERYVPEIHLANSTLRLEKWVSLDSAIQKTISVYQERK